MTDHNPDSLVGQFFYAPHNPPGCVLAQVSPYHYLCEIRYGDGPPNRFVTHVKDMEAAFWRFYDSEDDARRKYERQCEQREAAENGALPRMPF
jgi:hypothetical protein